VETTGCSNCTDYDAGFNFSDPTPTPLPSPYQPGDGTVLTRRIYIPDSTRYPGPTYPTVVVAHAGGFKTGGTQDPGPEQVAGDFQRIGYLAISVTYRLAPCNVIQGQHCHDGTPDGIASGRLDQQTNDMKAQVRAARAHSLSNGWVAIVGGSAGGSHAARLAFDKTPTNNVWPHWCENNMDDRPNAIACLSGSYNYADKRDAPDNSFRNLIENYTNICNPPDQLPLSPVSFLQPDTTQQPFRPMIIFNSLDGETIPYAQLLDMLCVLQDKAISTTKYQAIGVPGILHAFDYWHDYDSQTPPQRVRDDAVAFFANHM
jgi:hypothetical protein